ncbi:MAG TPA: leucyl aminopeptidase [Acidobacteriaceae bacterium]|nr:leucyl aminopeptidase [Acidobacteriaceae bacterium]
MKLDLQCVAPSSLSTGLLVVFAADNNTSKDKNAQPEIALLSTEESLQSAVARVLADGEFKARPNETLLLHSPQGLKAARLLVVGLGKAAKVSAHDLRKAAGTATRYAKSRGIHALAILAPAHLSAAITARAIAEGAILGDFESDTYRTDRTDQSIASVSVVASESDHLGAETGLREGVIVAESQNFARTLINEPANRMTPTILAQKAAEMSAEFGLRCEVYSTEKLRELKMGAFLGVAQGSDEPPALIVMTYEPSDAPAEPVLGLVGKGVTFDSGGLSLKPADSMEKMKYDMAGGAAMIGAMRAIAQLKPKVRIISIICATENMPSGKAQRPGDVQIAMSGKSIEVVNTDAEGRLVLADGLFYARQLGATHLINAATLTGAVAIALGQVNAGVFSNDEAAYAHFTQALETSGEKFWRLPLEDDYRDQIQSAIADIRNTGLTRYGGATNAAMFLKEFVDDMPWVHLDIAAMAWLDSDKPWIAKGPSGIAVRSIVEWARSYAPHNLHQK